MVEGRFLVSHSLTPFSLCSPPPSYLALDQHDITKKVHQKLATNYNFPTDEEIILKLYYHMLFNDPCIIHSLNMVILYFISMVLTMV